MGNIVDFPGKAPEQTRTVTQDGKTVLVRVCRGDNEQAWIMEIEDDYGNATIWDDPFPTPQSALEAGLVAIRQEGIDSFIGSAEDALPSGLIATVNRGAIILKVREPLVAWLNRLTPDVTWTLEQVNQQPHIYLVDDPDSDPDPLGLVRSMHEQLFEAELAGWSVDDSEWPQQRDWPLFQQWFECHYQSLVFDLGTTALERDDF
jgi:hypothetical protein